MSSLTLSPLAVSVILAVSIQQEVTAVFRFPLVNNVLHVFPHSWLFLLLLLPLQFLLLLGCFALFWSLYYTLEVTLAHLDLRVLVCRRWGRHRARRGRRGRGAEDAAVEEVRDEEEVDSGVELHAVLDSEAKASLLGGDQLVAYTGPEDGSKI